MANKSIFDAFERMWQHVVARFGDYTTNESFNSHVNNKSNPHEVTKEQIGLGNVDNTADAAKVVLSATKATQDANGNNIAATYETKSEAESKLAESKAYSDAAAAAVKNDLLNGAGEAYDTLQELGKLIDENTDALQALEEVATSKADKSDIVQSDWDQNDEIALDYIKNRTHWAETIATWDGDIANKTAYSFNDSATPIRYFFVKSYNELEIDTYDMPDAQYATDSYTVGNVWGWDVMPNYIYTIEDSLTISDENFGETTFGEAGLYFAYNLTGGYFKKLEQIHQLDKKYIPNTIAKDLDLEVINYNLTNQINYNSEQILRLDETLLEKADKSDLIQSDWNQNDEEANDYIKNRSHYDNGIVENILVDNQTISGFEVIENSIYFALNPFFINLVKDRTYKVSWDGTEHELVAKFDEDDLMVYIGDLNFGEDIPFVISSASDSATFVETKSAAESHVISITEMFHDIKQIDEKFIPDFIARVEYIDNQISTPDWNQNDESAKDFIKNKPFGESGDSKSTLITSGIVTIENYQGIVNTDSSFLEQEIPYYVIFNNIYFPATYHNNDNYCGIGNASLYVSDGYDSGELFFICAESSTSLGFYVIQDFDDDDYEFEIWADVPTIKTLDEKYLPIVPIEKGGTGQTSIADTTYTTARYRASSLHSTETTPTTNGVIAWTYE